MAEHRLPLPHVPLVGPAGGAGHGAVPAPPGTDAAPDSRSGLRRAGLSRRAGTVLRRVVDGLLVALVVVVLGAGVASVTGRVHFEVVESGSMRPVLPVGGVSVLEPEPLSSLRAGQLLAYHPPGEPHYLRLHRVIWLGHRAGAVWVRTKGDANNVADAGPIRLVGSKVWVAHWCIPYLGYVEVWLSHPLVRDGLYVVLFLLVGMGVVNLWRPERPKGDESNPQRDPVRAREETAVAPHDAA